MPLLAKNRKYVACSIEQNFAAAFPKEIVIDPAKKSRVSCTWNSLRCIGNLQGQRNREIVRSITNKIERLKLSKTIS